MSRLEFCVVWLLLVAGATQAIAGPVVAVFFGGEGQDPGDPANPDPDLGITQLSNKLGSLFHEHSYERRVYRWNVDLQIPEDFIFKFPDDRWVILAGYSKGGSAVTALSLNMWLKHDLFEYYDDAVVTIDPVMGIGGSWTLAPGPDRGENYYETCDWLVGRFVATDIDYMENIDVGAEYGFALPFRSHWGLDRNTLVHDLAANFIVHQYLGQPVSRTRWQPSATSGDWDSPGNWDTGSAPSSDSVATLVNTSVPTAQEAVVTADATVNVVGIVGSAGVMRVVVETGATLTGTIGVAAADKGWIELQGGTIATMALDLTNGLLSGIGTVDSDVRNAGTLAPGSSTGVLAVTGDYTQDAAGTLQIELGGLRPGSEYDRLDVAGSFAAGGTLDVALVDLGNGLFNPQLGDTFDVFDFADASGSFDAVNLPDLRGGLQWDTSALLASGELSVIPEPSTLVLLGMGAVGLLAARAWRNRRRQ